MHRNDVVTVQVTRRVKPGHEADYEARLEQLMAQTRSAPGYLGGTTQRPHGPVPEYTSVLRFDTLEHLRAFEHSAQRQAFVSDVAAWVDDAGQWQDLTGMEFWFVPPAGTAVAQPSAWRMAVMLVLVVYTLISTVSAVLGPWLAAWPSPLRMFIVVVVQVLLMTYVVMPRLTRHLSAWLYPQAPAKP